MPLLLLLLAITWTDSANLASDNFDTRQTAEQRLGWLGPLALPALAWAGRQPDLEQRRRAQRLLLPLRQRGERIGITLLATWLFYGPDEVQSCRYLVHNRPFVEQLPIWLHLRLRDEAVRFGFFAPGTQITLDRGYRVGWINVIRHRAYHVPSPTTH